ncbi:PREDICTED: aspartic proteinase CDR1-like [Tarenaya hassleriana]|uniref:aspartic proteinase CDR1-like n=1 Tax=Tarenaya hassleriana TaxID=28532 RepID=UPI00053C0B0E|nr:PREDICTED: aspartic proteinase CDR1-like [Tarenaya hassleriana]
MAFLAFCVSAVQAILLLFAADAAPQDGITAELIYHDSIRTPSPYSNPYQSMRSFRPTRSPYSDAVSSYLGGYLMKIKIGTPPVEIMGFADTGSGLIWTQCLPCARCFPQDYHKFNPLASSTYQDLPCGSRQCKTINRATNCHGDKNSVCPYTIVYGDKTFSIGTVGFDTFTLGLTSGTHFSLIGTLFGCGRNNTSIESGDMTGIIGLDWGPFSLISQMGDRIQGLFSYCLGAKTSKINFGANAIVSGRGTMSTLLYRKKFSPNFYYLNLEAVSVDDAWVETSGTSMGSKDGNIVIDSGTTYLMLAEDYFQRVKEAVTAAMRAKGANPQDKNCYSPCNLEDFPVITMHFAGADLVLGRSNTYYNVDDGVVCLKIAPTPGHPPIFGYEAQSNFLIGYDTVSRIISFKPTNCSSVWH